MRIRKPRVGVVTFPGSLDDRDALRAVRFMGGEGVSLWHADPDLHGVDAADRDAALAQVEELARKLLANPVIEGVDVREAG